MRFVLPGLIIIAVLWALVTLFHPSAGSATYQVMVSKNGLRIFAVCLAAAALLAYFRNRT